MIETVKNCVRKLRQLFFRWKVRQCNDYVITNNSIVIIAPHPDDETFGCAGLIALKVGQGVDVSVIFLTNGEKSLLGVSKEEILLHRQNSALNAAKSLGVKQTYFMNFSDDVIPRQRDFGFDTAADKVADLIEAIAPSEVFCTHISEGWSDHTAAAELTRSALQKLDKPITFYYYWVWVWFSVPLKNMNVLNFSNTFYLPIRSVIQQKKDAINQYLNDLHVSGMPYCGRLPKMFLKAFDWPYEVFEKVEYK